jgi:hypothetical protein
MPKMPIFILQKNNLTIFYENNTLKNTKFYFERKG